MGVAIHDRVSLRLTILQHAIMAHYRATHECRLLIASLLVLLALSRVAVGQAIHRLPDTDPLTRVYCDAVTESCVACQQGDYCVPHSAPQAKSAQVTGMRNWKKGAWQITPYGFLSGEMIASDAPLTARPFVLYVNSDLGTDEKQFTVHGQTTALGIDFQGPMVGSFQAGGNVLFNFLGDRPVLNQSTPFLLRAYGDLKSEDWRIGFGVAPDIFGALTPATVNFGGNIQAGNIAAFRGQFRVERYQHTADNVRWTFITALSQQVVSDFVANPSAVGTDNGWPNVEGRIQVELGPSLNAESPIQLGTSGVIGETRAIDLAGRNVSTTWGLSADCQIDRGPVGFRCEVFTGEAIGTYNAAIGQSLNPMDGEPIATVGGFAEIWFQPLDCLTWHFGYGVDDPENSDLGQILNSSGVAIAGQRSRNTVYWTTIMWNVTRSFELGLEASYRETDYVFPSVSNDAMVFHFRSRLVF